jgi:5-methylcytosine-specific restriction endonuclease McrA
MNEMCSSWITPTRRLALYIRDEFTCCYCGRNMKNDEPNFVTLDHLVPRNPLVAHGGGDNSNENLVTACKSCNSSRQDKPWMDYATGGAIDRINTRRYQAVNTKLAKSLLDGTAGDPETENLR